MTWSGVTLWCFLFVAYAAIYTHSAVGAELPEEIRFQVFVAFDNVLHTAFSNPSKAQKYAVVFFNAVNLIFREMTNPRIKFEVVMFHDQNVQFTSPALEIEDNEVNATASLPKAAEYTSTPLQFQPSDIIFIMSGRKVFSKGYNKKDYFPQGLTWEGGICNPNKRVVIVSDIGKHFGALPNAAFQLARLLGAPTTCTSDYFKLSGNSWLFKLNDCAKNNITQHLTELYQNDTGGTQLCFSRKYRTSMSQNITDLPSSFISEDEFCKENIGGPWDKFATKRVCKKNGDNWRNEFVHVQETVVNTALDVPDQRIYKSQTGGCFFRCCYTDNQGRYAYDQLMPTYYNLDGSRCATTDGICVLGQCVTDNKL